MSIQTLKFKISNLPKSPGVYEFRGKNGEVLYIGKATSLRDRARSYFNLRRDADPRIARMVENIADVCVHKTDTVLEALILEANLIKKLQPKYNVRERDDKSMGYFVITKEDFPRVVIPWKTELGKVAAKRIYGPYASKHQMGVALKIMRRIFPFHSGKQKTEKGCLDYEIGRCPGPYAGAITKKDYLKNINGIEMILRGQKKRLISRLKKEMKDYSKKSEYEKAAEIRNRIFALEHIQDVALIASDEKFQIPNSKFQKIRIEGYDVSNIGGEYAVGSMAVFINGKTDKDQYRKFKIRTVAGADDVGMMREVLMRRFRNDWPKPDIIVLDGGKGHLNMAQRALNDFKLNIPIIAVAKGPKRKKLDIYQSKFLLEYLGRNEELRKKYNLVLSDKKLLERIRNEAHRFAVSYHRKLREKRQKASIESSK